MNEYALILMRSLIAFFVILVFMRMMGKQQLAELSLIEFVIAITIGSIASTASVELENSPLPTLFAVVVWAGLAVLLTQSQMYNRGLNRLMNGRPKVVIDGGRIDKVALRSERLTMEDLLMLLRKKGAFDLKEVEIAVVERDGTLSVLKKTQHDPATPHDLGVETEYKGMPTVLILDGHIQDENLREIGQNKEWLREQVHRQGVPTTDQVIYCAIDTSGTIYVDAERRDQAKRGDIQ